MAQPVSAVVHRSGSGSNENTKKLS